MTNEQNPLTGGESLSAFMDGEAQELELRRSIRDIPVTPELREKWFRYHLASSIIQQQNHYPVTSIKLADEVRRAILQIDSSSVGDLGGASDNQSVVGVWQKSASRFAVAASVAIAVVVGVQWQQKMQMSAQVADAPHGNVQINRVEQVKPSVSAPVLVSQPLIGVMPPLQRVGIQNGTYIPYPVQRASLEVKKSVIPLAE
jgi:negative regulator of sigma E activity